MNDIKCDICKKEIKSNDDILLGSKQNYASLPDDIKSSDVVFLHNDCFTKWSKENETSN